MMAAVLPESVVLAHLSSANACRFFVVETRQLRTGPETYLSYYPDEKRSSNIKEAGDSPVLLQTLTHVSLSE